MTQDDFEHLQEYNEWRKSVEFHHEDEWEELQKRENVFLDSEGSYSVVCNSVEDFITFATKLDDTEVLERNGIVLPVWQAEGDDEECEEYERYMSTEDIWDDGQMFELSYNHFMPPEKRIYLEKTDTPRRSRKSIVLNPDIILTFPCIFLYGRGMVSGKIGSQVRNCCHFLPVNTPAGEATELISVC